MIVASKTAFDAVDAKKYSHPIPNRDFILGLLKRHGDFMQRRQLATTMKLSAKQELEALRRRLRAMERDGQVLFDHRRGYRVLDKEDLITGRVIGHRDGFGFLVNDAGGDDLLLSKHDMMQIFDGDCIQARVSGVDHRGRKKATLVKVTERALSQVLGELCFDDGGYYIVPENSRIAQEIDVDGNHLKGAKAGQYVVVTIADFPCHQFRAFGRISRVLGDPMAPGMEIQVAINQHGIPDSWSADVKRASRSFGAQVAEADKHNRADLRHLPFVTIDGEDAKDFDDAVFCETLADGWRLQVAIADVSHYVAPGSALDTEAQKRGTSVYFPGYVVPMLPESLSNGLCSLNPDVDRLVIVCEMKLSKSGKITDYQFSEAVIHSHARLTYSQVNALLTAPESDAGKRMLREHSSLVPHIKSVHQLYGVLRKARSSRGAMDFDSRETRYLFDSNRKIQQILPVERNDAHRLVEECMLCANVAAARFLKKLKVPVLYRNHEAPKEDKLKSLQGFLAGKGLKLAGGDKPTPVHYDRLLRHVGERSDADIIQGVMLRSLSQADYSIDLKGHFGLAYSEYAHFTSPIRRYPDLLVHRAIRAAIREKQSKGAARRVLQSVTSLVQSAGRRTKDDSVSATGSAYPYDRENMALLAASCSQLSRRADKAGWDVDAWLKCEYMQDAVGKSFWGSVTKVTGFGLFVELDSTGIEGLVHINSLGKDFYHFDAGRQLLKGERTNERYSLGDKIQVSVVRVDMETKKIEFGLASAGSR